MLGPYRAILSQPGALQFTVAGFISRLPISMIGIGIVLMVSGIYGSYGMAGRISAAYIVTQAICAPQLSKLVDRYGQARIMRPSLAIACMALMALIVTAVLRGPIWLLFAAGILVGATVGAMGALVRARWSGVLSTPNALHTAYALESALDELTFVTGPVIATLLATAITPWAALIAPLLAGSIGGFWLLAQRSTEPAALGADYDPRSSGKVMSPALLVVIGIFIATGAVFGGADVAVVAFTEEHGAKQYAGVVLGSFAFGSLLAGLAYGSRQWQSPLWLRFVIGTLLLAIGTATFLLATSVLMLGVIALIASCAIAPTLINGNNVVHAKVDPNRLTEGLTWLAAAIGIGVSLGSFAAGTAIDAAGSRAGFYVVTGAAGMAALIAIIGTRALQAPGANEPATIEDESPSLEE